MTADLPPRPIEKGRPGPGLLAYVAVSKYADHLPLYRLEDVFLRQGVELSRSTMADWIGKTADLLEPVVKEMRRDLLESERVHADDAPVPVQDGEREGTTRTARIWAYVGDEGHPNTGYDYTPNRCGEGPEAYLAGYEGYLQVDAYAGYDAMFRRGKIVEVGCWAHARRKFFEAQSTDPLAEEALTRIGALYAVEREAEGLSSEERRRLRQEKAKPVLEAFRTWLEAESRIVLPKSPLGEAIGYALNPWEALTRYLENGNLRIDNNAAERALRRGVIGRKNRLFAGSDEGGRRAAILYSLVETCRRHGIDPQAYLADILERISTHPQSRIAELTPIGWKTLRAQTPVGLPASAHPPFKDAAPAPA